MTKKAAKAHPTLEIPKIILYTGRFLSFISSKLAVRFAARLFTTPLKHQAPKREMEMDAQSKQERMLVPEIGKEVVVYHYGSSSKKILLVHGWSGRGTQLVKFAEALLKIGYATVSFDAPAHGKSPGSTTLMPEFIASILELEKRCGPFEAAIGHSLGGMSLLNAVKRGLKIHRLTIIGSGDVVQDIINDFVKKLELDPKYNDLLREHFENKHQLSMDSFSAHHAARKTDIPILVIHDENDAEVPVTCAHHIHENLKHGALMLTQGLGHRKILGDAKVIQKTIQFIQS